LAIGKITKGLLSESSSTTVLPVRQKTVLGLLHPCIYICSTRIIRLQAVVEIITNETARALSLLAKQSTKMRNAIY
jgi:hypothetical protein